jgi:nucleotide-binding universal stress UspA family protein
VKRVEGRCPPPDRSHRGHGRIVVGVDGSEGSKAALRWAARQAEMTGASLEVVMTWELPVTPYAVWTDYDASGEARERLEATVQETLGTFNQNNIVVRTTEGRPALALRKAAEEADLLVVGSRGYGAFAGLLVGSVSQYCATHASCPVVVVPRPQ